MAETPRAPADAEAMALAERRLAGLQQQVTQTGVMLAQLRQDMVDAQAQLGSSQSAQLLEANEQLVLAAMLAQNQADKVAQALALASRSAELDLLTELPNRLLLFDRFAHAIAVARRRNVRLALLFLDLDHFKQVNDTLGHAAGDEVLRQAAHRLSGVVREADTVSRHGGDEFLILLTEVSQASDAALIADKVIDALAAPMPLADRVMRLSASIGISVYPDDGDSAEALIQKADAAMYRAKQQGRGGFVFHGQQAPRDARRQVPIPPLRSAAQQEQRHAQLCEANEQLVLAALDAQDLQRAAEQAHWRQTEFLAVLAHELRNPLMPISNATALLGRVRSNEPMLRKVQGVIERQVAHMTRLVGDLLDISRVNTGKLRLVRQELDLADLVADVVGVWQPLMHARLQALKLDMPAGALVMSADPLRLTQVLNNLLDNASKYTPDGGEIRLSVVMRGAELVITVDDSGIGIAAEALPKVFEPFVQDARAVGFNNVGLGLGLTVVRELVEAHGGTVQAGSAGTGQGSRFEVTLPLAGGAPVSA